MEMKKRTPKTVLLVEDNEMIRRVLRLFLLGLPLKLWEGKDGKEALHLAQQERPDLIITDLTMPVMDGIELTKAIRADVHLLHCPIIVFTGTSRELQHNARLAGANVVLEKPAIRREVIAAVERLLQWD